MDHKAYYEFEILKHVEQSPLLNNRMAARKLGVSVKLAHEVLKKMVAKGLLHVKKEHTRRWDYFLTPHGIAEKTRLTYEFLEFSMQFYREARRRSAQLCRDLSESGIKQVGFIGAGELAEIVYLGVVEWNLDLAMVYDDERQGQQFMGVPVLPLSALPPFASGQDTPTPEPGTGNPERFIVCLYNKAHPMTPDFLPAGVQPDERMRWVFTAPTK